MNGDQASPEDIIQELQMLTNLSSRNSTLLFYHLVKDGIYFKDKEDNVFNSEIKVKSFDDWFDNL